MVLKCFEEIDKSIPPYSWLISLNIMVDHHQCDQKKSPNVYKSFPNMISLEKW